MARTAEKFSDISPAIMPVLEALSQALGMHDVPKFGFERKELLEVSKALYRNYHDQEKDHLIRAIGVIIERNQNGEYMTPRRAFWYICQRMRELYPQLKQSPHLSKWQSQMQHAGDPAPMALQQVPMIRSDDEI